MGLLLLSYLVLVARIGDSQHMIGMEALDPVDLGVNPQIFAKFLLPSLCFHTGPLSGNQTTRPKFSNRWRPRPGTELAGCDLDMAIMVLSLQNARGYVRTCGFQVFQLPGVFCAEGIKACGFCVGGPYPPETESLPCTSRFLPSSL